MNQHDENTVRLIKDKALGLDKAKDLQPLIEQICLSKVVMLGEASHGTHEFYTWRRAISEELIKKHGFKFIAVEGDWPPCWNLNSYIRAHNTKEASQVLASFNRWPTWMWANTDILELAENLRSHNNKVSKNHQVGFYGLDVYSLFESMDAVLNQVSVLDPALALQVRKRYACFEPYERDEKTYARSLIQDKAGCEAQVLENLQELLHLRITGSQENKDMIFNAQQNARVVAHAERYYRAMILGGDDNWNIRDRHMIDTLEILLEYFGSDTKGIVWAHNTHIGDYRATDMEQMGLVNIGGLAREKWGSERVSLIGFGTYEGEVIASHAWDGPVEKIKVPKARVHSYEALFHEAAQALQTNALLLTGLNMADMRTELAAPRGHRAIGVVYQPDHEKRNNYVATKLAHRYDAFIFIDKTTALKPLVQDRNKDEIPETWLFGQ